MPCVVLTLKCEYSTGQGFSVLAFFCVVASSQIFPQVVKHLFFNRDVLLERNEVAYIQSVLESFYLFLGCTLSCNSFLLWLLSP